MPTALANAEQRKHPRYELNLQARIRGLSVFTRDISRTGVQVWCPTTNFQPVFGKDLLPVRIDFPGDGPFVAICRMVYARVYLSQYLVGLDFANIEPEHSAKLRRLIDQLETRSSR